MPISYRGLTWDHPRGRDALRAAAALLAEDDVELTWDVQPLEGFESTPLDTLADTYDLIVMDHPHVGDAVALGCLRSVEEVFGEGAVADVAARAVGPSLDSYHLDGRTWALPLDAATQVSVMRPDLVETGPQTWDDVLDLARGGTTALSVSGPHAYLTYASVCASLGEPLAIGTADSVVSASVGEQAFAILTELARRAPAGSAEQNPIALLERMASTDEIGYIPLIYGYVNYADRRAAHPLDFRASPTGPGDRIGSTIGGTGLAVTRRCEPTEALRRHILWLLGDDAQRTFIPDHAGQPSMLAAWTDERVNRDSGDFYLRTLPTISGAWVRPRFPGFTQTQSALSALVRQVLDGESSPREGISRMTDLQNAAIARAVGAPSPEGHHA
ncbi:membrane protein [Microbacterium sediminicola]|uniref:Membrane protein n=1 Tax=Microbacterium sediminicola TaxID=415210 RepID=A0ABP4U8Z3_9MICO